MASSQAQPEFKYPKRFFSRGGNGESKAFTTPLTKCRSPKGDEGLGGVEWVGQSSQGGFAEGPYQDTKATHLGNSALSTKHL